MSDNFYSEDPDGPFFRGTIGTAGNRLVRRNDLLRFLGRRREAEREAEREARRVGKKDDRSGRKRLVRGKLNTATESG